MNVSPWILQHSTRLVRTMDEAIDELRRAGIDGPVYLGGPIHGCSDEECQGWRERAERRLGNCINPILWDFRGREAENAVEIVRRDLSEIDRSGALLVNVSGIRGAGTSMEMRHAYAELRRPVFAFTEEA